MEIEVEDVSFSYRYPGKEIKALKGINLKICPGELLVIAGASGSGKSTLAELLAGLKLPTAGSVYLDGVATSARGALVKRLRRRVGIAFQYPERQLFAETVAEDVAFGPRNLGLPEQEVERRVEISLLSVGLDPEIYRRCSPFSLSGGQQRRVALAGILAMEPEVLILDEPTAGLDPEGRRALLALVQAYHRQPGKAVVLISHHLAEVARLATRLVVLCRGEIVFKGGVRELFATGERLAEWGLAPPPLVEVLLALKKKGADISPVALTLEEAERELLGWLKGVRPPLKALPH
ncbi:MAG: energy-coupling factor transport system ATP-binding protein [Clostridia bacterium]|nr:energy-coupling factor transport system ATP-binding protein [Clostridia bacterium]